MAAFSKISKWRTAAQLTVFISAVGLSLAHQLWGIEKVASIDAYCPFGGIEAALTYVSSGTFLKRIFVSSFVLLGITLLLTVLFGRVFCSFFCPLGALQEWTRSLGRKMGIKKDWELPRRADALLRYAKYPVLAAIIYFSYKTGDLVFRSVDPFNALMHLGAEFAEKKIGYSVLALVVGLSFFSKNIWCRYACPLGASLAIVKKISPFSVKRNAATCISCKGCDRVCPANLPVSEAGVLKNADCLSCGKCVESCPRQSLSFNLFGKAVSVRFFAALVISVAAVSFGAAWVSPLWKTKPSSNIVATSGKVDVANIRGSNTLAALIGQTGVPLEVFVAELGLPQNVDISLKLKDIGPEYEIVLQDGTALETEHFRKVVEKHLAK